MGANPRGHEDKSGAGQFMIVLDIARVHLLSAFEARVDRFIAALKAASEYELNSPLP